MVRLKVIAFPLKAKQCLKGYNKTPTNRIHDAWEFDNKLLGMQIYLKIWPIKTRRLHHRN